MWRPTVRYSDVFQTYVEDLFQVTKLDRNQIIRLALFTAAHSDNFRSVLLKYKKSDVPLPSPSWQVSDSHFWKGNTQIKREERRDVNNAELGRRKNVEKDFINSYRGTKTGEKEFERHQQIEGRTGEVPEGESIELQNKGGILTWTLG